MERSKIRLHLDPVVPPPPPPRTVTLLKPTTSNQSGNVMFENSYYIHIHIYIMFNIFGNLNFYKQHVRYGFRNLVYFFRTDKVSITSKESNEINGTSSFWIPKVITESVAGNSVDEADTTKVIAERQSSHHSLTPSPEQNFGKKLPQYNSFRMMKQKVNASNYSRSKRQFKVFRNYR